MESDNESERPANVESFDAARRGRHALARIRMSLLSRLLGLSLFVVLTALVALLWLAANAEPARAGAVPDPRPAASAATRHARLARLPLRAALPLAATGAVLAAALLVSLSLRPARPGHSAPPFAAARAEIDPLEQLARTSLAQGEALARERDVRVRAEENARLNERRLSQSVEERVQLGRDLHDGIIQSLYATGLLVESTRRLLKPDPAAADRRLARVVDQLNAAIRELRTCIGGLAPAHLRRDTFVQSVRALFDELAPDRDATIELNIDDTAAATLTSGQETELLQIAREALSNSLRHGRARRLTVRLHPGDGALALLVQDDGRGFDPAATPSGHGRANMQARAARLGATLTVQSHPGGGTRIVLTLPIPDVA